MFLSSRLRGMMAVKTIVSLTVSPPQGDKSILSDTTISAIAASLATKSSQLDDFGGEEESGRDYPCPYCYEEFDVASLCSHLEDEHSGEYSNASVCPICSAKVAQDLLNHITLRHGLLNKRRNRLRRVPIPNSQSLSLLGRDLKEAHPRSLLEGNVHRSNNVTPLDAVTDPVISSLLSNSSSISDQTDVISKILMSSIDDNSSRSMVSHIVWKSSSLDSSLSHEEREKE
ncbi:hypothetical protein DH2020_032792 [Rehmannia glutinosa]|uniref:Uncharacterized protein n=1 Tax=Rehmannia glutinosa TaxID=99300 RepID=A0ABR0VHC3_REHGL